MLAKQEHLLLRDIEEAASRCTGVAINHFASGLTINASGPQGFQMSVMIEDGRFALYFDDWMEEFESEDIVRDVLEAALRGEARLRVDTLAGRRWRWTLERLDAAGNWVSESTISHVIWRFWGPQSTLYLKNTFACRAVSGPMVGNAQERPN